MLDVCSLASVLSGMLEVKEAERLLRGAESLARLATSVLQTLAQSSTLIPKPNDRGELAGEVKLSNRVVCKQNDRCVYMRQLMMSIGELSTDSTRRFATKLDAFSAKDAPNIAMKKVSTNMQTLVHSLGL